MPPSCGESDFEDFPTPQSDVNHCDDLDFPPPPPPDSDPEDSSFLNHSTDMNIMKQIPVPVSAKLDANVFGTQEHEVYPSPPPAYTDSDSASDSGDFPPPPPPEVEEKESALNRLDGHVAAKTSSKSVAGSDRSAITPAVPPRGRLRKARPPALPPFPTHLRQTQPRYRGFSEIHARVPFQSRTTRLFVCPTQYDFARRAS